ncbi:MAG: esterase-like activity of phytase family protein [Erythrobacter sp.]|nr:esterase-like activity of phytase family protein [Erythrobacter sp.]
MRAIGRLTAALAVALLCAPGTWLRSPVEPALLPDITATLIVDAAPTPVAQWSLAGVWQYRAPSSFFGGFSAMFALEQGRFIAFTDRGYRMTFTAPDLPAPRMAMIRQAVPPGQEYILTDIESATHDPATGSYWLGYEQVHTIQRSTIAGRSDGVRDLRDAVRWPDNAGVEAMVRLADGRFVAVPEGRCEGLIFTADPVGGGAPATFRFRPPAKGYEATDMAQLPDGRLLVLMRKLARPSRTVWPPFSALLAIGEVPQAGGEFAPAITLPLDRVIPRENYEGLALRPRGDGRVDVWVMSDDNFSIIQRSLLAKLVFDPQI